MQTLIRGLAIVAAFAMASCASTFESTWRDPSMTSLNMAGKKVAAIAMVEDQSLLRAAEDSLAQAITDYGAIGVPLYTIVPNERNASEASVRAALEKGGFVGAVVMRPIASEQKVTSTAPMYTGPSYDPFWGGYYGYGWHDPFGPTYVGGSIRTDTIVSIETLVYSLKENKLAWGGVSKSTNPSDVAKVVRQTADKLAKQLKEEGLINPEAGKQ